MRRLPPEGDFTLTWDRSKSRAEVLLHEHRRLPRLDAPALSLLASLSCKQAEGSLIRLCCVSTGARGGLPSKDLVIKDRRPQEELVSPRS